MKRFNIILFFLIGSLLLSCVQEQPDRTLIAKSTSTSIRTRSTMEDYDTVEDLADDYYDDILTMIYATDAMRLSETSNVNYNTDNPFSNMLASLDIVDVNDDPVSFYDLPPLQRELLLTEMLNADKEETLTKLSLIDNYAEDILDEMNAMDAVVDDYSITRMYLDAPDPDGMSSILPPDCLNDLENPDDPSDPEDEEELLEALNEALEEATDHDYDSSWTTITSNWINTHSISSSSVLNEWSGVARRGDILLTLPRPGVPWVYYNPFSDYRVGHAGVLTKAITSATLPSEDISVECWNDENGVQRKKVDSWTLKHYVLGFRHVYHRWQWHGLWGSYQRTYEYVNDPSSLASFAEAQIGKQYVTWSEFLVAKTVVPLRYTCTTLVWEGLIASFGVDISKSWSLLITPSAIYSSPNTYVRAIVD